jgi:hypothetical protein
MQCTENGKHPTEIDMSKNVKANEQIAKAQALTIDNTTGLPVQTGLPEVKSEAEMYAEHRTFIVESAGEVIKACLALQTTEKKVRAQWWHVLQGIASKVTPGNGQSFGREYDAVRQEILDKLAASDDDALRFVPPSDAESIGAKWRALEKARSGYSTFANYASQTRRWIEDVKATPDPKQSAESFGLTVRAYYEAAKEAEKGRAPDANGKKAGATAAKSEAGLEGAPKTDEAALTVGAAQAEILVPDKDGKFHKETISFPHEVREAMARLGKEIGVALHAGIDPKRIVEALNACRNHVGGLK